MTDLVEDVLGHPVPERGENAMVRCPLHEDRRPSLSINLNTGLWLCFSCTEKGSLQKLARICDGELDSAELALRAARLASSSPYFEEPPDFTDKAIKLHIAARTESPQAIIDYINGKQLHSKVFGKFRLGWDGVKISMPYFTDGRCTAIKYRYPDGHKDAEKGGKRAIYNIDDIRSKPIVIVCEGESDTHAVWSEMLRRQVSDEVAVCGIPGASVTKEQWELWALDLLWTRKVYMAWDADEPGDKGSATAMSVLGEKCLRARPVRGKDVNLHLMNGGSLEECGMASSDLRALLP